MNPKRHPIIANLHFHMSDDGKNFCVKKHPVSIWGKDSKAVLEQVTKLGMRLDGSKKSQFPRHALSYVTFSLPEGVSKYDGNRTIGPVQLENGRVYFGQLEDNNCRAFRAREKECEAYDDTVVVVRCGLLFPLCCYDDVVVGAYDKREPVLHGKVIREGDGGYPHPVQLRLIERRRQNQNHL